MKTALITLSAEGARLLTPLANRLPEARLFIHESVRFGPPLDRKGTVPDRREPAIVSVSLPAGSNCDPDGREPAMPGRDNTDQERPPSAGNDPESYPESPTVERFSRIADLTARLFPLCRALVYAAPAGVVVRALAPLVSSKYTDPAVVVVDAGGRWAVSLLSGHEGGANDLAIRVANLTGAEPVITTTTEALKSVIVGIGCRRGTPAERIVAAVREALADAGVALDEVRLLASAEVKADEPGLLAAAETLGVPIRFLPAEEIRGSLREFSLSAFVEKKVDLPAVAEPAALLAGKRTRFILRKKAYSGITIALARETFLWPESVPEDG